MRTVIARAALVATVLGLPLNATKAGAQDAPDPWIELAIVQVEPSRVDEFLAVQRDMKAYALKNKVAWRSVSRTATFGDSFRFLIATPAPNLASFDSADTSPEWMSLVSRAQRAIVSRQAYAVRVIPEALNPLPEDEVPNLMVVNLAIIAPGREQEYMDIMTSDFLPHFEDAGVHQVTGALALGGEGGFLHVFYVDDFAELDQGSPAMRGLSAEGAQVATKKFAGVVIRNELWVSRLVPEASYQALPEETEEP